jgi:hypothetical protein
MVSITGLKLSGSPLLQFAFHMSNRLFDRIEGALERALLCLVKFGINGAALSRVYSSSALGSLGTIVITPPEALNSSSWPLLKPALRRTARGTTERRFVIVLDGDSHSNE